MIDQMILLNDSACTGRSLRLPCLCGSRNTQDNCGAHLPSALGSLSSGLQSHPGQVPKVATCWRCLRTMLSEYAMLGTHQLNNRSIRCRIAFRARTWRSAHMAAGNIDFCPVLSIGLIPVFVRGRLPPDRGKYRQQRCHRCYMR